MSQVMCDERYWDCECDKHYIHPASDESCPECGAIRDESPDSHLFEVLYYIENGEYRNG